MYRSIKVALCLSGVFAAAVAFPSAATAVGQPADIAVPGHDPSGSVISTQTDEKGAEFQLYDSGDWTIQIPASQPGEVGTNALEFEAGACAGTFAQISVVANGLVWGSQNACVGTDPNAVYPHSLRMELRSTCSGFPCGILNVEREASAPGSLYDNVKTVAESEPCVTGTTYEYDQIAYPTVNGVEYGPFVDSPLAVVPCNINPD
jgi:hypothetical protein